MGMSTLGRGDPQEPHPSEAAWRLALLPRQDPRLLPAPGAGLHVGDLEPCGSAPDAHVGLTGPA